MNWLTSVLKERIAGIEGVKSRLPCFSGFLPDQQARHCRMGYTESYEELKYLHELLRSRVRIREHYLGTVVKEIYENIGQVLTLIRIKLALLRPDMEDDKQEVLSSSGDMVGKTIDDLRNMRRLLYADDLILGGHGIPALISEEIRARFPGVASDIDEKNLYTGLISDKAFVFIAMLLELLDRVEKDHLPMRSLEIKKANDRISLKMFLSALENPGKVSARCGWKRELSARARFFGGSLQINPRKDGSRTIILEVPIH